jgi:Spy/CpxP family protein refolding chaperone
VPKLTLTICLALGLAGVALAQRGGMGFGGGLGFLAMNPGVQKEIKVTDEQKDKLKDTMTKVREDHKDDMEKLRDRDTAPEERQKLMKSFNDDTDKALGKVLDDKQMKRLRQISLQNQGAFAFRNPDVLSKLSLKDDQKEKIKTISEEAGQKMRDLFQGGFNEEARTKMAELNKETMEKIRGVLTDEQKKTWKEMTGEPFQVQFQPRNQN